MRPPTRLHETDWHVVGERAFAAGIEVAEEIERLQQLGRGWCGAKFEICRQERCELTHTTVPLIKQREIVKLFRLSKSLRFSHGRFKSGPWQYGLNRGKHITAAGARFDKNLAHSEPLSPERSIAIFFLDC